MKDYCSKNNGVLFKTALLTAVALSVFILWLIYLRNTNKDIIIFQLVKEIPYGDKIAHVVLFGFLTLTVNIGVKFRSILFLDRKLYFGTLLVSIFVVVEELSQELFPTRTLDINDLLADAIGISLFTIATYWVHRQLSKS